MGADLGCLLVLLYVLGTSFAVVITWEINHSVLWATIHGTLSWFYVAYCLISTLNHHHRARGVFLT